MFPPDHLSLGCYPNADPRDAGPCSREAPGSVPRAHGRQRSPLGTEWTVPSWQGLHPRALSWDVRAGAVPGFASPPWLPFLRLCAVARRAWTSRTRRAAATGKGPWGPGWTRGPPHIQLRFAPQRPPLQLSCPGTLFPKSGCGFAILPSPLRPLFRLQKAAVRGPLKSPQECAGRGVPRAERAPGCAAAPSSGAARKRMSRAGTDRRGPGL